MRRLSVPFVCLAALPLSAQQPGPVVFSELMWAGSSASTADEWVELYNRSSAEVDLDGWTITRLVSDGDKPMVRLKGSVRPGATFLIANFAPDDPRSKLAVRPQLVASSLSLPNTKLLLRLYSGDPEKGATLVDVADDGTGSPMAGDAQAKCAMVRVLLDGDGSNPGSWATARESMGWDPGATERGTPGAFPPGPASASAATGGVPAAQGDDREADPAAASSAPDTPTPETGTREVAPDTQPPEPPVPATAGSTRPEGVPQSAAGSPPNAPGVPPGEPSGTEVGPADAGEGFADDPPEPEPELPAPSQVQGATWGNIKSGRATE